jgi:hypothetical protein
MDHQARALHREAISHLASKLDTATFYREVHRKGGNPDVALQARGETYARQVPTMSEYVKALGLKLT